MERALHELAPGCKRSRLARRPRDERDVRRDGSVLRHGALHLVEDVPPVSNNWGYFTSPELDDLIAKARTSFADKDRDAALGNLHARIVEEAPFLWVAHDVGPRAVSPKLKGVVQPKSWFIDLATVSME